MTASPSGSDHLKEEPGRSANAGGKRWAPFVVRRRGHGWQVQMIWRNFAAWFVLALVVGWAGAASAAYLWVKHNRGFTAVKFTDMLFLPTRWHEYQKSRGDFLIQTAQAELKEQRYREAFHALRTGLHRSPANKEGRMLLAQFYGAWRRPELTRQILLEGVKYHDQDIDYLRSLFSFLLNLQEDRKILELQREIVGSDQTPTPRNQLVALAAATASYFRGNYDESEALLRRYLLEGSREGRLLAARITWDRGARDQALEMLRALAADFPTDEEVYGQTIGYLRAAGRDEEARRESFVRALANPANARARIDQLYAQHQLKNTTELEQSIEEIFRDFAGDANALTALGDFAANTGNHELARRVYAHAKANKLAWESAALMTVEAYVVSQRYQEALEMVRRLQRENPDWNKRFSGVFNGLQAIAHYGMGDAEAAQLFLNNYLSQTTLRAENLVAVSKRLLAVGAKAQARQVLDQAVQADPLNQPALTNLIKLDLELNNTAPLPGNVRKLLAMRRPSQELLRTVYDRFGSDLFLFSPERTTLLHDLRAAISPVAIGS